MWKLLVIILKETNCYLRRQFMQSLKEHLQKSFSYVQKDLISYEDILVKIGYNVRIH